MNKWRAAAAVWGAVTLFLALALALQLKRGLRFETDMLALLPVDAQRPLIGETVSRMAEAGSRRVVLLVGGSDLAQAAGGGRLRVALERSKGHRERDGLNRRGHGRRRARFLFSLALPHAERRAARSTVEGQGRADAGRRRKKSL